MSTEYVDVLIVGAGLSGIGAAYHLQKECPDKRFAILEARERIGGTWDLFRYPGVRSDSDMYTLGYAFRPWRGAKGIADGPDILQYIKDTARENGIDTTIRFQHRVTRAEWSSADAVWTVSIERGPSREPVRLQCNFLFMCSGYYDYAQGYTPEFPGLEHYRGHLVHPQQWTEDIAYAGKRVVVIGSGATAVTLVPAMAKKAAHVTMLQRSPTYMVSMPDRDGMAAWLQRHLPEGVAYGLTRWQHILIGMAFYSLSRHAPHLVKRLLRKGVQAQLGEGYDVETHFTPSYNPWDQRVCLVPNGDLFRAIRRGRASVVTDTIDHFTETGITLRSGAELEADIIVTATGLNLLALGGMQIAVDGRGVSVSDTLSYKGMMLSDVPNLAVAMGYTNASWTLKCDLTCEYVCRLLNFMDAHGHRQCTPRRKQASIETIPFLDLTSGYVLRSIDRFPKQGARRPWRLYQNYLLDIVALRFGALQDGVMEFGGVPAAVPASEEPVAQAM